MYQIRASIWKFQNPHNNPRFLNHLSNSSHNFFMCAFMRKNKNKIKHLYPKPTLKTYFLLWYLLQCHKYVLMHDICVCKKCLVVCLLWAINLVFFALFFNSLLYKLCLLWWKFYFVCEAFKFLIEISFIFYILIKNAVKVSFQRITIELLKGFNWI